MSQSQDDNILDSITVAGSQPTPQAGSTAIQDVTNETTIEATNLNVEGGNAMRRTGRGPHIGYNRGPSDTIWSLGTGSKSLATSFKCCWLVFHFIFLSFFVRLPLVLLPVSFSRC
jgi:hypothetical protein